MKLLSLFIVIVMMFVTGCGNNDIQDEPIQEKQTMNETVNQIQVEEKYQPQTGEIYVGHFDYNGRDCYLLKDSIHENSDRSVDCKIKMAKSANDIEYLQYKFEGKGTLKFTTNTGFSSTADKYETPIEYSIYEQLTNYVDMSYNYGLNITPEQFIERYNAHLIKLSNSEEYNRLKITGTDNIYLDNKCIGLVFKMNDRYLSISSGGKDKYLKNIIVEYPFEMLRMNSKIWSEFVGLMVVTASSINEQKNDKEITNMVKSLLTQFDNGNMSPEINMDGIKYSIGPMMSMNNKIKGATTAFCISKNK